MGIQRVCLASSCIQSLKSTVRARPETGVTFTCALAGGSVNPLSVSGSLSVVFPLPGAASPRGALSTCSLAPPPPSHSLGTVMMGNTMVGVFLSAAFTRDELLAECLAGEVVPASCFDSSLVSVLVVKSRTGIFECTLITTEVQ